VYGSIELSIFAIALVSLLMTPASHGNSRDELYMTRSSCRTINELPGFFIKQ